MQRTSNKHKTTKTIKNHGEKTYRTTVNGGYYDKYVGGLFGKHDNVRTYCEDQITETSW